MCRYTVNPGNVSTGRAESQSDLSNVDVEIYLQSDLSIGVEIYLQSDLSIVVETEKCLQSDPSIYVVELCSL